MEFLQKAFEFISKIGSSEVMTAGIILEVVLRLVKTDKPKSILLMVASGLEVVGKIATKTSEILNKVIPQRLK